MNGQKRDTPNGSRKWGFNFVLILIKSWIGEIAYPAFLSHIFSSMIELIIKMKKLLIILFILFLAPYSFADEKRYNVPLLDSPVLGPANAPVTIIEFLDYQ